MVPTIFWSACAEGVLKENDEHLDPDGCLVQQCRHRTDEDAAKAGGRHEADRTKKPRFAQGGQLWQEKLLGKSVFLTKTFLWVPGERVALLVGSENHHYRKEHAEAKCS